MTEASPKRTLTTKSGSGRLRGNVATVGGPKGTTQGRGDGIEVQEDA